MIRIVVLDDSTDAMTQIFRLLHDQREIEVVGSAADGQAGLQVLRETRPDVLLLEMDLPLVDGLTLAQTITKTMPSVQIIAMSANSDLASVRRAMHAGAREYVVKPGELDDLADKIRQVNALDRTGPETPTSGQEQQGEVITIFGPRGGSGVTTLTVNLALALRQVSHGEIVVVDGSLQFGDVGVMLNLHSERHIGELARRVEEVDSAFAEQMAVAHPSGIRALLAPPVPEMADLVTGECIRRTLAALKQKADYVLYDGGHYLGEPLLAALDASDRLLLVSTPDVPSIKSTSLMLGVLDALDFERRRYSLILSHVGRRHAVRTQDMERSLGTSAFACLPFDDTGPLQAANQGRPLVDSDPDASLSRAVLQLARQIARPAQEAVPSKEAPKAKRRFAFLGGV